MRWLLAVCIEASFLFMQGFSKHIGLRDKVQQLQLSPLPTSLSPSMFVIIQGGYFFSRLARFHPERTSGMSPFSNHNLCEVVWDFQFVVISIHRLFTDNRQTADWQTQTDRRQTFFRWHTYITQADDRRTACDRQTIDRRHLDIRHNRQSANYFRKASDI